MGASGPKAFALINTALSMVGGMQQSQQNNDSEQADRLREERLAREEEQRKEEAADRKQERDKVTEARDLERRRAAEKDTSTLLTNGGAGLTSEADVATNKLKSKFGE